MSAKRAFIVVGLSMLIMLLLLFIVYDFEMNWMNLSNVFFFVGVIYFFPGLVVVTGATDIFNSINYLTRRIFLKPKGNSSHFKTLNDYLEYKHLKNTNETSNSKGLLLVVLGGSYIILSIVFGKFV